MQILALDELTNHNAVQEIAKAAFVILGERFMFAVDAYSVRNKKKMHHVYEWGKIGNPSARLFVLDRTRIYGGGLITTSRFLNSKIPGPIDPEL